MDAETITITAVSFACALLLIPLLMRVATRTGLLMDQPSRRKQHGAATPSVGGIAIFAGSMLALLFNPLIDASYWGFAAAATLVVAIGVIDDIRPLPSATRISVQLIAALVLALWGDVVGENAGPLLGGQDIHLGMLAVPITVFATIGMINAMNMIDGLDGLAGSLAFITLALLAALAALAGDAATASVLASVCAGLVAFLCFNLRMPGRSRALVFMGDAGSMLLGFVIAWAIVSLSQEPVNAVSPISALWLFALPLFDTVTIMLRRVRKGRSPFCADRGHLHHLLLDAGYSVNQTVAIMAAIALGFAGWGLLGHFAALPDALMFYSFCLVFVLYFWGSRRAWPLAKLPGNAC